jgi:signal peptidase I
VSSAPYRPGMGGALKGLLGMLLVGACLTLAIKVFLVELIVVSDPMMAPTLEQGDWFVGVKWVREPKPADLVVLTAEGKSYVRRVIAAGGQKVGYRKGNPFVDGAAFPTKDTGEEATFSIPRADGLADQRKAKVLEQRIGERSFRIYVDPKERSRRRKAKKVPAGHVWVSCDNRSYCRDSRHFGTVPRAAVWAVAWEDATR